VGAGVNRERPLLRTWYRERIDASRHHLETRYADTHSLATLARRVAMSPFHFARVFRELTGSPPHRYLRHIRLDQAARRLHDGLSVTDTCFEVGFSNLSHFTRSFSRAYGVPPSRYRAQLARLCKHPAPSPR
jgi:AraC family transcriptional regulator